MIPVNCCLLGWPWWRCKQRGTSDAARRPRPKCGGGGRWLEHILIGEWVTALPENKERSWICLICDWGFVVGDLRFVLLEIGVGLRGLNGWIGLG